ncbi:MAG: ATP-dependent DNA helicase, partial [Oscillospiraceae bacterium]|nr:ATP-dependent DNA helicase [Oscillospiraceae bacterium]
GLCDPFTLVTGFDRKNLYFEVRRPSDKTADLKSLVKKYSNEDRSGIIYCSTRKNVENLYTLLKDSGYSVSRYHAGLSEGERAKNQEDFIYDRIKVMIATNAFGMGIDKSNVTFVIHYNMPKDVESYYQEAGRAGRDGSPSDCILLYSGQDVVTAKFLINKSFEESELPTEEAEAVRRRDLKRLSDMIFYCTGADCLRSYILKYFGEKSPNECGNCSYCCSNSGREDITVDAQKIMSCIARAGQRFGMSVICDTLRGKKSEKLTERGLDKISTYGIMADCPEARLKLICDKLTVMGYIEKTEGQYPVLRLTKKSASVLRGMEKITARLPQTTEKKSGATAVYTVNSELFEQLRALRRKIAKVQSMPDYVIFTDMSLQDMCRRLPCTEDEFLKVSGVGEAKLERYGGEFIDVIREYVEEKSPEPVMMTGKSPSRRSLKKEEDIKRGWETICENSGKIRINDTQITITAFADQIISDTGAEVASVPIRKAITDWLIAEGFLTETKDEHNHSYKTVTENSAEVGICREWVTTAAGRRYIRVRYKPEAQQFIADNIESIGEFAVRQMNG